MKKKTKILISMAVLGVCLFIASQRIELTLGIRENNCNKDGKVLWSSWGINPGYDYIAYHKGTTENKILSIFVYGFESEDDIIYRHDIVLK